MRAVDTNVLVRMITRDDPRQAAAADAFVANGAWVSVLALAEASWVLTSVYDMSPAELGTSVRMLLDHEQLTLQDPDVIESALQTFTAKPTVGFSDALLLELARKAGHVPLGTFDRDLGRLRDAQKL
ncbi:MAG: PIN domain-containing protein [Acidobacteriota bacterium]|nr:PIN domain-containing protein [Acidobacteriota bacterium]MDP2389236.1 PIN domain-containing protein [Acidobacteriota bacterium]